MNRAGGSRKVCREICKALNPSMKPAEFRTANKNEDGGKIVELNVVFCWFMMENSRRWRKQNTPLSCRMLNPLGLAFRTVDNVSCFLTAWEIKLIPVALLTVEITSLIDRMPTMHFSCFWNGAVCPVLDILSNISSKWYTDFPSKSWLDDFFWSQTYLKLEVGTVTVFSDWSLILCPFWSQSIDLGGCPFSLCIFRAWGWDRYKPLLAIVPLDSLEKITKCSMQAA